MLKGHKVQAVALQLKEGGQAVLVQDGADWNGLRKFKCILVVMSSPDLAARLQR